MADLIDNRYTVLKVLGSGLSGEVLSVQDADGRKALKTLKKVQFNVSKEEALTNFKNEFSILSELNHPNIGRILDFGFDNRIQKYYFTTELIEGKDFYAATEGKSMTEIEDLAVQILRALTYLHSRGIYHFDIKPQNVLVAEKDGKMIGKIIDFGLAGFSSPRKKVGTPAYMAPEVILGGELDGRTDLYSFGVVLYKTLTRLNPFADKNMQETLSRQRTLVPEKPSKVKSEVPVFWDTIVMRLLEKNPSDRYVDGSSVIRDINFLANRHYEIETMDTRLSYLPEKGALVSRQKEVETFKTLFKVIFKEEAPNANRLLVVEGKAGTGKSRLLSEFKSHCQLNEIPVHAWKTFQKEMHLPPFCLQIDTADPVTADEVNRLLQEYANQKILILWATEKAPAGWSQCEIIHLGNFSEEDLGVYITTVTGLKDPPAKLIDEIHQRTGGNPLFITELLRTMLANNLLLDSSGRWVSTTFEDIGINFEKIQVPKTLVGLLEGKIKALDVETRGFLEWLAVFNRALSLDAIKNLTNAAHPQSVILNLTKEDLIERTDREQHYFFVNVLLRDVIYDALSAETKGRMHDQASHHLKEVGGTQEEILKHQGRGSETQLAIHALKSLGDLYLEQENYAAAVATLEEAWQRSQELAEQSKVETETWLAEATVKARDYRKAMDHYEHLKSIYDTNPIFRDSFDERITVHEKLGDLCIKLDQFDRALELFDQALQWIDKSENQQVRRMIIRNHEANAFMKSGKADKAEAMFRENYQVWEDEFTADERKQVTNNWLADVLIFKKEYDAALEQIEKDLLIFEEIENNFLLSRSWYLKGDVYFRQMISLTSEERNPLQRKAIEAFEKSLKIAKSINAYDMMLRAYNGIGNIHFDRKEYNLCDQDYQRALALARKTDEKLTAAFISTNLGNIAKIQEKHRDAYPYYIYSINTLEGLENKNSYTWTLMFTGLIELTETYIKMNELGKSEEALDRAEELIRTHRHLTSSEFYLWFWRAHLYTMQGHRSLCRDAMFKAEKLATNPLELKELDDFKKTVPEEAAPAVASEKSSVMLSWRVKTMSEQETGSVPSELETVLKINKFINSEHNLSLLFKMVLNYALELTGAESGLVLLVKESGELEIKSSLNTSVNADLTQISHSAAQKAMETGEVVISANALSDDRFDSSESVVLNELKSILCIPIKSRNKIIGVFYLDNRFRTDAFEKTNLKVLSAYCDQVGIALENARLFDQYQRVQKQLEEKLAQATGELNEVKEILKTEQSAFITKFSYSAIISKSKSMQETFKLLDKITETNLSVCIHGASGTGKELIARAIHFNNTVRRDRRFVAINCGAIPANLIESELFGHKAGSFTGAVKDKKGLFEEANGGTIFLDEVAELDTSLQVKLLRVLQEGEVQRIGDVKPVKVDARVIAASHKSLEDMVKNGTFREDLYYRLCQIKIPLPPLAERREDIPLLAEHFVDKYRRENNVRDKIRISPNFMKALFQYAWPGNIRELENTINVSCALRDGNLLDVNNLPPNFGMGVQRRVEASMSVSSISSFSESSTSVSTVFVDEDNLFDPAKTWADYEIVIIAKCYKTNGFKKGVTAEMLQISPSTLYNKIRDHDLENAQSRFYQDTFGYQPGTPLKAYIPKIFKAALNHAEGHPYAAIRQLGVSQGYFYKIMKQFQNVA